MPDNTIGSLVNTFDSAQSLRQNVQVERPEPARGPADDQAERNGATDRGSAVNVDLSPRAREILSALESEQTRNGNGQANGRANAPGQIVRDQGLSPQDGRDFGQAVSTVARGIDTTTSDDGQSGDTTAGLADTSGGDEGGTNIAPSVEELIEEGSSSDNDQQSGFDTGDLLTGNEGSGLA